MTMSRLSNEDRLVAIGMIEGSLSLRELARRMRCFASVISRIVQRNQETSSVRDKPRPGSQRVTKPAQDGHIRLIQLCNRFQIAVATAREIPGRNNPSISRMTVAHRLHENDLHTEKLFREKTPDSPDIFAKYKKRISVFPNGSFTLKHVDWRDGGNYERKIDQKHKQQYRLRILDVVDAVLPELELRDSIWVGQQLPGFLRAVLAALVHEGPGQSHEGAVCHLL
ncbi:UNVERIFIED_CONTAM: hypothetical protein FKN15_040345 [Acipenser sinensis]